MKRRALEGRRLTGLGRTKSRAYAPHEVSKREVVLKNDAVAYGPSIEPEVNERAGIKVKVLFLQLAVATD